MSKVTNEKPIKIPLKYEDTIKAFLETPPRRKKKPKKASQK